MASLRHSIAFIFLLSVFSPGITLNTGKSEIPTPPMMGRSVVNTYGFTLNYNTSNSRDITGVRAYIERSDNVEGIE
jgi:hypothetical protein